MNFIKKLILIFPFLFLISSPFALSDQSNDQSNCKNIFNNNQTDIFETTNIKSKNKRSVSKLSLKQKKEQAVQNFIQAFESQNVQNITNLVKEFPFLKSVRITDTKWLDKKIRKNEQKWCPEGWSFLQVASYTRNILMTKILLGLNFDVRSKKGRGGLSLEHNPLHIAIKKNYITGLEIIFSYIPAHDRTKKRGHFIDEKTQMKHTPWSLAINRDIKNLEKGTAKKLLFTPFLAQYKPSGYVESYVIARGPKDGFELAYMSKHPEIIRLAREHLRAKDYQTYKEIKQDYPPGFKRTSPPYSL